MPTLDSNEELEHKVVTIISFGRQEGKTAGEVADQIMQLHLADREAAIREAEKDGWQRTIQTLKIVHDEECVYGNSSMKSAKHWMKQAEKQLASLNQPTKEGVDEALHHD